MLLLRPREYRSPARPSHDSRPRDHSSHAPRELRCRGSRTDRPRRSSRRPQVRLTRHRTPAEPRNGRPQGGRPGRGCGAAAATSRPSPSQPTGSGTAGPRSWNASTVARITSHAGAGRFPGRHHRGDDPRPYANCVGSLGQTAAGRAAIGVEAMGKSERPRQISLPRPSGVSNLLSACERGR